VFWQVCQFIAQLSDIMRCTAVSGEDLVHRHLGLGSSGKKKMKKKQFGINHT
jgi:hypothetical protein